MKRILLFYMFLGTLYLIFGQKRAVQTCEDKDTLQKWMSKFYTITNPKISPNTRYVLVNKTYKRNNDTLLVFDSKNPGQPVYTLVKRSNTIFLDNDRLLAFGDGKAEVLNLKTSQKKIYENVQRAEALEKSEHYFILDKNKNLNLYDKNSKLIHSVSEVSQYTTDKKSKIFASQKEGKLNIVLNLKDERKTALYSTENEIIKLELTPSGKYLLVTEKVQNFDHLKITFVPANTDTNKNTNTTKGYQSFSGKADFVTVTEIGNGTSYFIDFDKRIPPVKEEMVEIWYGTDKNLRKKKYGTQAHEYQIWNTETNRSEKLSTDHFSTFAPIGSSRYFLAFNTEEEFNYSDTSLLFPVHVYDMNTQASRPAFSAVSNITASLNGEYILGFEEKQKIWVLYDLSTFTSTPIEKKGLRNPVFSRDALSVFFESGDDLWKLDTTPKKLFPLGIAKDKDVKIMDKETLPSYIQYNARFETGTIDVEKGIVLKIRYKKDNLTSYVGWKKGKQETLIPPTEKRIKDVKYNKDHKSIFSIEENYNSPPVLYQYKAQFKNREIRKTPIFKSGKDDKVIINLKQEILSYTNTAGTKLKGLLYYPIHFNPNQKYPMVVRIYQQQSEGSGIYPIPDFDEDGFNVRLLLENGYFVFLPDIIYDERGTGIAAFDCVNTGLDQLQAHPNIDEKKVGLTGHSMGGYETNFIATKSNRFAAYLSGASVNNIIKFYFSYNTHFNLFDFSRFENGQHEMNVPFSENKEKYFKNNPIHDVEKVSAPMLLWAGLKDENVTPDQTMAFYTGLLRNRKPAIALMYKDKGHDLGIGSQESKDLNLKTLEWWGYFLKDEKNIPWIEREMKYYQQ